MLKHTRIDLMNELFSFFPMNRQGKDHLTLALIVYLLAWRVFSIWWITRLSSRTWQTFLVAWDTYIVNSTSWAHVLPSSFIQQVPSCTAPSAFSWLIQQFFCQSVSLVPKCICAGLRRQSVCYVIVLHSLHLCCAAACRLHLNTLSQIIPINPKRNMPKRLTLKYMRGPQRPQKRNGMARKISKADNKLSLLYFKEDPNELHWAGLNEIPMTSWYSNERGTMY